MGRREDLMDLERLEVGSTPSKLKGLVCLGKKGLFDGKFGYAAQVRKAPDRLGQCKSPIAGLAVTTACMPFLKAEGLSLLSHLDQKVMSVLLFSW